jgi:hypothetical protein
MERTPSTPLPNRDGGKWRPPVAPGCRGSRGAPDGRGRRGAPRRANALSSPGKQRKGRRKMKSEEDKKVEPMDADASPGQNPGAPKFTLMGAGDRGG